MCLTYVLYTLKRPVPAWVAEAAQNSYGNPKRLNEATVMLCTLCREMTEEQKTTVMYDGRKAQARMLADWWEKHQQADAEREARQSAEQEQAATRKSALAKLTAKERKALVG